MSKITEFSRVFWEAKYAAWQRGHPGELAVPEETLRRWQRELEREVKRLEGKKGGK